MREDDGPVTNAELVTITADLAQKVGEHTGTLEGLDQWRIKQNGSLQRIETRLVRLESLLAMAVGLGIVNLVHAFIHTGP